MKTAFSETWNCYLKVTSENGSDKDIGGICVLEFE